MIEGYKLSTTTMTQDYQNQKEYELAKKKIKEIKGFYAHLFVTIFSFLIILFINLKFVPGFHFFWFALIGLLITLFIHWLGVFGLNAIGFGKKWEQQKINEILKENKSYDARF